jgi:LuxR family maltose regulon positive regulatory protein
VGKLTRPILTGVFARKRLFDLLDRMRERPVIWISGPAGCGKTTLVGSYLEACKLPCLWYQLDEGDADLATFFYYLGQGAKRAAPRQRKPLPLLTPEYRLGIPIFTRRYFEKLYSSLKPPSVLVLDNYQDVPEGSPFHEMILDGLSNIPDGINVILVSRKDPPPVFIRLQANHLMETLGWNDLRLTFEESDGVVRLRAKLKWSKEWIEHLHKTTDGWAAGLVLMVENAKREGIEAQVVGKLTPEEIFRYFSNEVLGKTDKEVQDFFLQTAFLPKMTVKMAEELTGLPSADRILSTLSRDNYFTMKSFHTGPIYQYHPLFRDFLLDRAGETLSPEALSALLKHAAIILEENGQVEAAVSLLHEVGDWDALVRLILKRAPLMVEQGRNRPLEDWLSTLPKDVIENNPWLLYWAGACRLPSNSSDCRPHFEKAFEGFKTQNDVNGICLALEGIVDSIIYAAADFKLLDQWITVLEETRHRFKVLPSDEIELILTCTIFFAMYYRQPQHPEIEEWEGRALSLAEGSSNLKLKMKILLCLLDYRLQIGDFGKAALAITSLQKLTQSRDVSPLMRIIQKIMEMVYLNYSGLHQKCLKALSDGLELCRNTGIHIFDHNFFHQATSSAHSLNDYKTAARFLDEMASSLSSFKPWGICFYHALRTHEALHRGDLGQASVHADLALKIGTDVGVHPTLSWCHFEKACVLHELGKHREAAEHLTHVFDIARNMRSKYLEFPALFAEALFAFDQGEEFLGLVSLQKALVLGSEGRFFNTWIAKPFALAGLCAKALEAGIEVEYVQELIRRNNIVPDKPPWHLENWPWPLKIYTLGRFELVKDGNPIQFSRKAQQRPLSMLKALIAWGGKEVREDQIADILWTEADGDAAHHAFETTLYRLRKLIGHEKAIQYREGRMTLDDRYCWVDLWAFEHILEEANAQRKKEVTDHAIHLTEKALELYRGSFLVGEAEQPWMISLRERLRSKFIRVVDWLGHHWEEAGQWEKAIECYQQGLEVDNLAEDFYRSLMICYQRVGKQSEALSIYEQCKRMVSESLGIEPSAKTEAVYKTLKRNANA